MQSLRLRVEGGSGGWEFVTEEEGCEALLEVAPGDASAKAGIGQDRSSVCVAAPAGVAIERRREALRGDPAFRLSFAEGARQFGA
jgi:hypothetical protein